MSHMGNQDVLLKKKDMLLEGDVVTTSIYFGPKDGFLCKWVQTVPWGAFSFIVKDTIRAYLNHDENYRIPEFYQKKTDYKKSITKSLAIQKEDYDVYSFIVSIEKYNRAFEIKSILRYYLEKDSNETVKLPERNFPKKVESVSEKKTAKSKHNKKTDTARNALLSISKEMNQGNYGI